MMMTIMTSPFQKMLATFFAFFVLDRNKWPFQGRSQHEREKSKHLLIFETGHFAFRISKENNRNKRTSAVMALVYDIYIIIIILCITGSGTCMLFPWSAVCRHGAVNESLHFTNLVCCSLSRVGSVGSAGTALITTSPRSPTTRRCSCRFSRSTSTWYGPFIAKSHVRPAGARDILPFLE